MTYTYKNISQETIDTGIVEIQKAGGSIRGRTFEISGVSGNYTFSNGTLTIEITDKPWLASWGMIEDKLDSYFS